MPKYTRKITVRLTDQEYQEIKEKAKNSDISKYIRGTILDHPYENPELIKEVQTLTYEMNRIGNNINQIAHRHNANLYHADDIQELKQMLSQIRTIVLNLRNKIMKGGN